MLINVLYIIFIGYEKPKETRILNRIEKVNEALTISCLYSVMLFTDFQPDIALRYQVGYFFCLQTVVIVVFNLLIIL